MSLKLQPWPWPFPQWDGTRWVMPSEQAPEEFLQRPDAPIEELEEAPF
jgi:hypothetical protein